MAEYWLDVDRVGFHRAFVTGRIPDHENFERELTAGQIRMIDAFLFEQQQALQEFLMGIVI